MLVGSKLCKISGPLFSRLHVTVRQRLPLALQLLRRPELKGLWTTPIQAHTATNRLQHRTAASMSAEPAIKPDEYHMGPGTLRVSRGAMHGEIRRRVVTHLTALTQKPGVVLLQGGSAFNVYTTDTERIFEQEHYMFYLFGVTEEDFFGALDLRTGTSTLFMPRYPASYAVWMGEIKGVDFFKAKYAVDAVHYVDEMPKVLASLDAPCLHLLVGTNTDSGKSTTPAHFEGIDQFPVEKELLYGALTECRVHKTPLELEVMAYANRVGCAGHVAAMQAARSGMMEYQIESVFLHHCYFHGGCRIAYYTPISASGPNGSILHYGHAGAPNDKQVQAGELLLADFGCEYYHYGSDITTTWPIGGKFDDADRRGVYETVLRAQQAVIAAMKPGVMWPDMQTLAYRIILEGLLALGVVQGDVQELADHNVAALFMPHGLGHLMGLHVHDAGGYPAGKPPRIDRPGYRSLRTARALEQDMVITVEPGCYFNPSLLLPALEDEAQGRFLVRDRVMALLQLGGVRLEDNVVITAEGARSLTSVPRRPEDIERVMAGEPWPLP